MLWKRAAYSFQNPMVPMPFLYEYSRRLSSYFYRANFDNWAFIDCLKYLEQKHRQRLDIRADTNDTHNLVNDTNNLWMRKDFSTAHDNDPDFLGEYQMCGKIQERIKSRNQTNQLRYYFAEYTHLSDC
ncbi:unnamed protein product [Rhizophagus irregularis]|nr:unnamed protein product [Rhizophagus irregularis]